MDTLGIIKKENTAFVLVDIQERFIPVIDNIEQVISNANTLVDVSKILNIHLIVTEQYPKGLGKTSDKISLPDNIKTIEKLSFSCFGSEEFVQEIKELKINTIILFGIEAHVCILKTALEAIKNGMAVHVVADAVSSRTSENKNIALERMKQSNVFIVSTEMIIFQLLGKAGTEEFKSISKLIK
ncbi:MAG: hydrolase [archaeon]|nr:hydrolase [archaeon]